MFLRTRLVVPVCSATIAGMAFCLPVASAVGNVSTGAPVEFHPAVSVAAKGTAIHMSQSDNWTGYNQGYLEKSETFHSISAQWTVPTATQHTAGQAEDSATWIGIGGGCLNTECSVTDSTLVQAGTEQDVDATGAASYSAWWEIVPCLPPVSRPASRFIRVTASVAPWLRPRPSCGRSN